MIIPEGTRLILDPRDELMHTPEPVSNFNESMYFNGFDLENRIGFWARIGNRPNEGHAEVSCCVYLPDGRIGFMFSKPTISDNAGLTAGGMRFDVVEPFKRLRIAYDGTLLLMADPNDMANPSQAFKTNPKGSCRFEFEVTGVSPMHGGEIVNLDGSPWVLDPVTAVFRGHTEQHTGLSGFIEVDGVHQTFSGYGFRDKSWGPRFWHSFYWYKWMPITFGPDFGVMLAWMGREGAQPYVNGHIFLDGKLEPLVDAQIESVFNEHEYQQSLIARLSTAEAEYVVEGTIQSLLPLRHRKLASDGREQTARITEGMALYTCNGRTALGMSEYLDLIVDGRPISRLV